ncbi:hypothetical protein B5E77_15540 [Lachnoclostridium sp. An131]|uniref:alpha/beta hydrolase fold domain-containing protein n=1 Tax=Lachnoclostridium sp. An131 TaxID=1965555 RepID=UPI000B37CD2B|nr:alpha/beta hydrolase fold domain-containing protein [Lachnoclostridium sp. An131]OUQ23467.1 hypothetical protein B5E77_15540 [Lachnoclostridium sp. An131]
MKRVICLLLALVMASALLAACGTNRGSGSSGDSEQSDHMESAESGEASENTGTENAGGSETSVSRVLIAYVPAEGQSSQDIQGEEQDGQEAQSAQNTDAAAYAASLIAQETGGTLYEISAAPEENPVENFAAYETVILGMESADGSLPEAAEDFLNAYDFGAKAVIPFVISGNEDSGTEGSGDLLSQTAESISQIQPGALVQSSGLEIPADGIEEQAERITEWAKSLGLDPEENAPESGAGSTVASASVDPRSRQTFYLWEEGNMPAVTEYTVNNGSYADDPDFRPTVRTFPVPEGTKIKGAVLICAGGAFQYRSDQYEGTPVAEALSERGYQSFVVDYRLRPYTQEEGALDLARAVRFVRSHADEYGIDEEDIAVMGFSAGGILSGEMLLNYDGTVNGTALDESYVPDALDEVSADAAACGMIYSFYGRLSVASTDVEKFRTSDLPPTYFAYGTRDPFVREFEKCIAALQEAEIPVESHVLEGMPHGFGAEGGWIPEYDAWLEAVFES